MVAVVGGVAIAIDGGIFFVVQRQLQTAADAGALAGAWHDPVCTIANWGAPNGCLPGPASAVATQVAQANADPIKQLCGGATVTTTATTGTQAAGGGQVNTIVVTVECSDRDANGDMKAFSTNLPCTTTKPEKCRIARLID